MIISLDIDWIANHLGKATRIRNGWLCLCTAHDDHYPSLSLSLSKEGKLLACCYAGCAFPEILSALGRRGLMEKGGLFQSNDTYKDIPPKASLTSRLPNSSKQTDGMVLRIWREASPAEGSPVQTYLRGRGYDGVIPPTLMYGPAVRVKRFIEKV